MKNVRLNIDEQANKTVELMLDHLKNNNDYIKINASKLTSWIIQRFYDNSFKREKSRIISDHFQKVDYFKSILNDMDESLDPEAMLKMMQKKIKYAQQNVVLSESKSSSSMKPVVANVSSNSEVQA